MFSSLESNVVHKTEVLCATDVETFKFIQQYKKVKKLLSYKFCPWLLSVDQQVSFVAGYYHGKPQNIPMGKQGVYYTNKQKNNSYKVL